MKIKLTQKLLVKVINNSIEYQIMTVLYLSMANGFDKEETGIPYDVVQDILMTKVNEMEFENDRDPKRKIS